MQRIKTTAYNTRTIQVSCLSHFLLLLLHPRQICNGLYRDRASVLNKTLYTLTFNLLPIKLVPRHSYNSDNLYLDSKKCAIPSLHRDYFLAKVPGLCRCLRRVTCLRGKLAPSLKQPIGLFLYARPSLLPGR
jgi:hypothetical protein